MERTSSERLRSTSSSDRAAGSVSFRAVVLPCGTLLPIEARLGRRLLRRIEPGSDEGQRLLDGDEVELIDPRGCEVEH